MRKKDIMLGSILIGSIIILLLGKRGSVEMQPAEISQKESVIDNETILETDKMDAHYCCYQITQFYPKCNRRY